MAISMDGLSSQFEQFQKTQATAKAESATTKDYSQATDDELLEACKEFETYFIEQIYKGYQSMVKLEDDDDDAMGQLGSYYKDQLTQQYAEKTSEQGGFGLAQQLYEQMKRNYNI